MVTTDEQLISLTQAMKNCPVIKSNEESQVSERGSSSRKIIDSPGGCGLITPGIKYGWSQQNCKLGGVIGCLYIGSTVTVTMATTIFS